MCSPLKGIVWFLSSVFWPEHSTHSCEEEEEGSLFVMTAVGSIAQVHEKHTQAKNKNTKTDELLLFILLLLLLLVIYGENY